MSRGEGKLCHLAVQGRTPGDAMPHPEDGSVAALLPDVQGRHTRKDSTPI